jgi:hypothetical protein
MELTNEELFEIQESNRIIEKDEYNLVTSCKDRRHQFLRDLNKILSIHRVNIAKAASFDVTFSDGQQYKLTLSGGRIQLVHSDPCIGKFGIGDGWI